uniref:ribosomal protein S20 n=1 Tax=Tsunamia transpacifica TaxID=1935457 RepID=UPI001BEE5809|nr:ribosomal protein S20 [Tsunamia transpacifica]QUE27935.1 ribosomal protein S20 [Tsunamia transpacifica]UNJ14450.1 ribosomal protein S20 [Tsunamia transpacifica]
MTQKKSIIKRIKVAKRNNSRNKVYKTSVKNVIKKCLLIIQSSEDLTSSGISSQIALAHSKIDKAVQKGVLHKNTGARKKSRLSRALKKVSSRK